MKTLCVAVFVLSLASVCQPASLACKKLLKPAKKTPDLSGSWYYIALSLDNSSVFTEMNVGGVMTMTPMDTPNMYNVSIKLKVDGRCINKSLPFFYENGTLFKVNSNNVPVNKTDVLLKTRCSDCIVGKGSGDVMFGIMLLSRRKSVTDAELREFEEQTDCLGWSKPKLLNSDHDFENCPSLATGDTDSNTPLRTCQAENQVC